MRIALAAFAAILAATAVTVTPARAETPSNLAKGNYRIDAVAEPGAPEIWDAADVIVRDPAGRVVARRHAVPAVVDLPRADGYTVTVIYKQSAARTDLSPGRNQVNLRAGEATLRLVTDSGGRDGPRPNGWEVFRYAPGHETGALVARSSAARPLLTLSEGWYEVRAVHAGGVTQHVIEVDAGRRFDYSIVAEGS